MSFDKLKGLAQGIVGSAISKNIIEVSSEDRQLLVKEPLIAFVMRRLLAARNIQGVENIYVSTDGICVDHKQIGIFAIKLTSICQTAKGIEFRFNVVMLLDRRRDALFDDFISGIVKSALGGVALVVTHGFFGGTLLSSGVASAAYATASNILLDDPKFLGNGQTHFVAYPDTTTRSSVVGVIPENSSIQYAVDSRKGEIAVGLSSVSAANIATIKSNISGIYKQVIEGISGNK
jgi:hypothetical protein